MIAAVTLCAPLLLIIMSVDCIFGMGGSSVIARLLGEEKKKEAGAGMNFCIYATTVSGIVTLVLGLAFLEPLAKISGADTDNIAHTCDYLKWIFSGAPFSRSTSSRCLCCREVPLAVPQALFLTGIHFHISQKWRGGLSCL